MGTTGSAINYDRLVISASMLLSFLVFYVQPMAVASQSNVAGEKAVALADASLPRILEQPTTYCNPLNLDYAFAPDKDYSKNNSHRSTADPVCLYYQNKYFLFSTNQEGYWWSNDLLGWQFISHKFKPNANNDQVCAPAAWPTDRGLLFLPCFTKDVTMPLYVSSDPLNNVWKEATKEFPIATWDPAIFQDDDKKIYVYWGSSNVYPIYGVQVDPDNGYKPLAPPVELIHLQPEKHGWEQFGEDNQNGKMKPFIEGAWMNKFNGKYYLQYGAPGTEWNVYGDGVYVSDHPLGPFTYQAFNPFSWKPTGFIRGAGHGSTFVDRYDNIWHVATMVVAIKHIFERRLGLFPSGVDTDGTLFADTSFGDYPHTVPQERVQADSTFTGWMLLSYKKKSWASQSDSDSTLAFDEDIKTYWHAPDGKAGHFLAVDLGAPSQVQAVQVNFAEDKAALYGKQLDKSYKYKIFSSNDGQDWSLLVNKENNTKDVPHDYIQFAAPVKTRFLKIENIAVPSGNFAIGDFRVFGKGAEATPDAPDGLSVNRSAQDRRDATISWAEVPRAYAYNISYGVSPEHLHGSILVYGRNQYQLHALNTGSKYYFSVQAVGEGGVSKPGAVASAE